jgi:NADH:ubiquinone oxidoreductase subunit 2 (subunit N)
MTLDRFTNAWMRIGTGSKAHTPYSEHYRREITGEKGIGRFAVRFLGRALHLESVADDSERCLTTKLIADFGGLASSMPVFAGLFLFIAFASIGLPGLNGFVGEFLILMGSYPTLPFYTVIAAVGVILAAVYLLWAYERVFTGKPTDPANHGLADLSIGETLVFIPLVALIILLGVYPKVALDVIGPSTDAVLARIEATTGYEAPDPGGPGLILSGGGE